MIYRFSYKEAHKHFIDIEFQIDNIQESKTYLQLPAWRPGRYELQNYGRNIQKFSITDEKGNSISHRKISKERWEADTIGVNTLYVRYNYYCYQMDAGGCWLDQEQIYLNFICCCLYVPGRELEPCSVKFEIPDNYLLACGLKKNGKELLAKDFYELSDCPMIASADLLHRTYEVNNHTFNIWIKGNVEPDWNLILSDFKKFTEENFKVFGEFPEDDYHFLYEIVPFKQYHGVEHRNSTIVTLGPAEIFNSQALYESFLGISCHELFHAWNALKIRPVEMIPYDLTKENYFKTGYVLEGATTYYGDLLLARSGVFTIDQYFFELNGVFKKHFENFGRFNLSLADSSFDLWIDGYVNGIPNRKVSIYGKGAVVSLLLDLEIRKATNGKRSMDDVMRYLWVNFGKVGKGYSEDDYQNIVETIAGVSFKDYFKDCIYGIVPIESRLNNALKFVGCELSVEPASYAQERLFGFRVCQKDNKTFVDLIEPDSPADKFLTKDDEIVSVNETRVNYNISELVKGQTLIDIKFTRFGKIYETTLQADNRTYLNQYRIKKRKDANESEKENFTGWLNSKF